MAEDINKKIINLFSKHSKSLPTEEKIKYYAGFHYVKLNKDSNGKKFSPEHLKKYAESCHYIVRVMREQNGETYLYNYDVPNTELFKFIKSFEATTLDGTIIEIDKYFPDDLA